MEITLNGKPTEIDDGTTIGQLIDSMQDSLPKMYVIEKNGVIIYKESYPDERLSQGDIIEIVMFCGGG